MIKCIVNVYLTFGNDFRATFEDYIFAIEHELTNTAELRKYVFNSVKNCYKDNKTVSVYSGRLNHVCIDLYEESCKDEYRGLIRIDKNVFFNLIEWYVKKALSNECN